MSGAGVQPAPLPRWLPWAFVGLLALPFHPLWVDFEQVRRALLLVLAGGCLCWLPLPAVRGSTVCWCLFAAFAASAGCNLAEQWLASSEQEPRSFQAWEAGYRLAHWLALGVALRLGASAPGAFATPLAGVLLVTSGYGLLQRLGFAAIASYGLPHEPVSTFGNLNVASEWTAVAAAAVAALGPGRPWLRHAALLAAGAYLVVDQSRSGLVALPLGLSLLWLLRRDARGSWPLAACALGAALGLAIEAAAPRPAGRGDSETAAAAQRATKTLEVRFEIAKASLALAGESPLLGHGPGQFQVLYPRVRTAAEIEASSLGRSFATEVRTAHDDWIELFVEGGALALLLFAGALVALCRSAGDAARLVPLFVLGLLMFARSPLWNAPAAVAAALLAGSATAAAAPRASARRLAGALLGAGLAVLGVLPLAAHTLALPYLGAIAAGERPPLGALERASSCMPFEPRWKQLLAQEQLAAGDLAAAARTAARAIGLRPFDPQLYVLLGEILARGSRYAEAGAMARHALAIDPPNPELRVLLSAVLAQQQETDAAIAAVVEAPHPRLRARLAQHFGDLAVRAADPIASARYRVEQAYVLAADSIGDTSPGGRTATSEHVKALLRALHDAGRQQRDVRGHVAGALHAFDLGDAETAARLGAQAAAMGAPFPEWQRALLGERLSPLRQIDAWRPVLDAR